MYSFQGWEATDRITFRRIKRGEINPEVNDRREKMLFIRTERTNERFLYRSCIMFEGTFGFSLP